MSLQKIRDESFQAIIDPLERIANSLEHSAVDSPLVITIIGALVASVAAYTFNRLHWKELSRKESIVNELNLIQGFLEELENLSVEYWLSDAIADTSERADEIRIKALLLSSMSHASLVAANFKIKNNAKNELVELIGDLFDMITGDKFEVDDRTPNQRLASTIVTKFRICRAKISELKYKN